VHARFFAPGAYGSGDRIDLPEDEAQHLARVLRLRVGDAVTVFDGRGREFAGTIASTTKSAATVAVGDAQPARPEPRIAVTLAHAVLKGDKMDDVVRDAVMLGVAAIQPVVSARSEVALQALERGNRRDRWARVAVSSAKQCGRAVVPPVLAPIAFDALIAALGRLELPQPALMLVEPSAAESGQGLADIDPLPPKEATIVVGPEGGWTADEIDRGGAVCRLVRFGGLTLRADAMTVVAMAALFTKWGEF